MILTEFLVVLYADQSVSSLCRESTDSLIQVTYMYETINKRGDTVCYYTEAEALPPFSETYSAAEKQPFDVRAPLVNLDKKNSTLTILGS